jgi:hypothetical protein
MERASSSAIGVSVGLSLLLAGLVILVVAGAGAAPAGAVDTTTVTVDTLQTSFQSTGITLGEGETVKLVAKGDGTCHAGGAGDCPIGDASGVGATCGGFEPGPAGPDIPYGAVAGRLGADGKGFLVGEKATVTGPGELFLVYNDCNPTKGGYSDNAGSFQVTISDLGPAIIRGRVVDEKGFGVPAVTVSASPEGGGGGKAARRGPGGRAKTTTGTDGSFKLEIVSPEESFLPAEYRVKAKSDAISKFKPETHSVTVKPGRRTTANFKAKADCRKGEVEDSRIFRPKHGAFYSDDQKLFVYYACKSEQAVLVVREATLICQDSSELALDAAAGTRFVDVDANGGFDYRGPRASELGAGSLHPPEMLVEIRVDGEFNGRERARAVIVLIASFRGPETEPPCRTVIRANDIRWTNLEPN